MTQGDAHGETQVLIDDINAHGGAAGRKLVPVWHTYDAQSTNTSEAQAQAACGLGAYFMVRDDGAENAKRAQASARPSVVPRDISSRDVDPAPLTEQEVFPQGTQLTIPGNNQPYPILKTQASTDCHVAAEQDLGTLLTQLGCSQVVRATLKSPDGQYVMTAGIFNDEDEPFVARHLRAMLQIRGSVDSIAESVACGMPLSWAS